MENMKPQVGQESVRIGFPSLGQCSVCSFQSVSSPALLWAGSGNLWHSDRAEASGLLHARAVHGPGWYSGRVDSSLLYCLSCALPSSEHPWAVSHAGIMPPNAQDHHTGLRSGQGGLCSEHPNMEAGLLEPPSSGIRSGLELPRTWRIRGAFSFLLR